MVKPKCRYVPVCRVRRRTRLRDTVWVRVRVRVRVRVEQGGYYTWQPA